MSDVTIDIGRVVIDGAGAQPSGGEGFARATESALQGLVEQQGLSFSAAETEATQINAPDGQFLSGASDEQLAEELAQAVYRALGMLR
jgi:hypothetical protein